MTDRLHQSGLLGGKDPEDMVLIEGNGLIEEL